MSNHDVQPVMGRYPPADISPAEFETFVAELIDSLGDDVEAPRVAVHDRVDGTDGSYEFDSTVRFGWRGLDFVVVVEAKRHANPIKREQVQVLYQKVQSVGAHKGVMFSTSPFQRGALEFARAHGIALVTVTEGRFTYETKSAERPAPLTREQAKEYFSLPTFVGHAYSAGEESGSTMMTLISTDHPEYLRELFLPDAG